MLLCSHVLLLALTASSVLAALKQIPDFIKVCSRDDPGLDACVTESVMAMRGHLAKGVPELLVPSIEPLLLGDMVALQGAGIVMRAYNVSARGCSDFKLSRMSVKPSERISFRLHFPRLRVAARYDITGRVLLLPLTGSGPFAGNFTECVSDVVLKTHVSDNLVLDSLTVKVTVGGGRLELRNLFGGEPTLGGVVNGVINANLESVVGEILPSIERALNEKIGEITRQVLGAFTFDQLFPPKE